MTEHPIEHRIEQVRRGDIKPPTATEKIMEIVFPLFGLIAPSTKRRNDALKQIVAQSKEEKEQEEHRSSLERTRATDALRQDFTFDDEKQSDE